MCMKTKRISSQKKHGSCRLTVGIDIGDQWSHYCLLSDDGEVVEEGRIRTTTTALAKHFEGFAVLGLRLKTERIRSGSTNSFVDMDTR